MSEHFGIRYRVYLKHIVGVIRDLLPEEDLTRKKVTQQTIAASVVRSPSSFSRYWSKSVTRAQVAELDEILRTLCQKRANGAKSADEKEACAAAFSLLTPSLDRTVRILESLVNSGTWTGGGSRRAISGAEEVDALRIAWARSTACLENRPATQTEALEIGRSVWPHMPDQQIGWAYHALGDLLTHVTPLRGSERELAAEHYYTAEKHHAAALITTLMRRAECYMGNGPDEDKADELEKERCEFLFEAIRSLNAVYKLPSGLQADVEKIQAEWQARREEPSAGRFSAAATLYDIALTESHPDKGTASSSRANLLLNAGYCWLRAGHPDKAIERLELAMKRFLQAKLVYQFAYTLKYLGLCREALGEKAGAIWCFRVSASLYDRLSDPGRAKDREHLYKHLNRISVGSEEVPTPLSLLPGSSALQEAERILQLYRTSWTAKN